MKKNLLLAAGLNFVAVFAVAQTVTVAPSTLTFTNSLTSVTDSLAIRITNASTDTVRIIDVNTHAPEFSVRDTSFVVLPSDSHFVWVRFSSSHNLTFRDVIIFEAQDGNGASAVSVIGSKRYGDAYDSTTQNLSGEPLKAAIRNLTVNHTNRGYNGIRDLMFLRVDAVGGQLECVYTGRLVPVTDRTTMQNAPNNFNTEHTWPQSNFLEQEPERADINHLFPTDATANNQRNNFPFGIVTGTPTWSVAGSKLGTDAGGRTVFEPRDVHKGDLARAMFYFIVRYQNWGTFWTNSGVNQEATFRLWNAFDSPSLKEKARNDKVGGDSVQGKRNPFIDHPEFVERISKFDGTASIAAIPRMDVAPRVLTFPATNVGDTTRRTVIIASVGSAVLQVGTCSVTNPTYRVVGSVSSLNQGTYTTLTIEFIPQSPGSISATISIPSNDPATPTLLVPLEGIGVPSTGIMDDALSIPSDMQLHVFPNPFNPETVVSYKVAEFRSQKSEVSLRIYDLLGREVAVLVDEVQGPGQHVVRWNGFHSTSGMYIVRLSAGGASVSQRMMLLK